MTPINFVPTESDLLVWDRTKSSIFNASGSKKSHSARPKKWLLIPWAIASITIAIAWLPSFLSHRSALIQRSDLQFDHSQFLQLTARISAIDRALSQQKQDINNFSTLFTSSSPAYLFAFYLQRSIPVTVNLNSFVIDASNFNICAFGPDYESLEDMIDLLKAMPIVDSTTILFKDIASDTTVLESSSGCQSLSPAKPVSAFIKGSFLPLTTSDLEPLYASSFDYGHYNKIKIYNSLLQKTKDID